MQAQSSHVGMHTDASAAQRRTSSTAWHSMALQQEHLRDQYSLSPDHTDILIGMPLTMLQVDAHLNGFTALLAACVQGHAAAALWLLQRGAHVAARKQDGWHDSALHYAAARGSVDTCKALLAYGADASVVNYAGKSAAAVAAKSRHAQVRWRAPALQQLNAVIQSSLHSTAVREPASSAAQHCTTRASSQWATCTPPCRLHTVLPWMHHPPPPASPAAGHLPVRGGGRHLPAAY